MPSLTTALFVAAVTIAAACSGPEVQDDPPDAGVPRITWFQDVGPVIAQRCMSCHQDGGIAPFPLTEYDDAVAIAPQLLEAVDTGLMPPFDAYAEDDCQPRHGWKGDPRVTPDERDLLARWITDGLVRGDEVLLEPAPVERLAGVTHSMSPVEGFVTTGSVDQFMCFVLDPALTTEMWLTGWEVVPTNLEVVHHVVVTPLAADLLALAHQYDVVGKPIPCVPSTMTETIGAWTPGQAPFETPAGVAWKLPANSGIQIQMHYHPGGRATNDPDATGVNLRLQAAAPAKSYVIGGWGNAGQAPALLPGAHDNGGVEFRIPANVAEHVETMRFAVDLPDGAARIPLFVSQPHMHYFGTRLEVRIERAAPAPGEPANECLISSRWDFDWQRTYQYDAPIAELPTFGDGDVVEVRCTYDNTLENPFVQRALMEQGLSAPIDVFLGGQSLDEMCLGIFGMIVDLPAEPPPPV